ncbi:DUF3892 domain-containing protein [Salinibacterium sp. UTAS2018]|uniref:DUF3892 domain-containing protein n=1 Tax=Salinibacterium sp. UTAS2018 TaxID=2508880 RepID=UPI00143E05AE|nr:DUF3892 domain-containing protein [Salinibacterium sp. UTAS2018]
MLYIRQARVQAPGTTNLHITDVKYSTTITGPLVSVSRDVIAAVIDAGGHDFRTRNDVTGAEATVVTRAGASGSTYITTIADNRETNNLLELPRFV